MTLLTRIRYLMVIITSSYVTLGIAAPADAQKLWAPYAGVTFVIALVNLWRYG